VLLLAEHQITDTQTIHHVRTRCLLCIIILHSRIFIFQQHDSKFLPRYHFIYYKNPMYTTCFVVEPIPPLTSLVIASFPPVIIVQSCCRSAQSSSSPAHEQLRLASPSLRQFTSFRFVQSHEPPVTTHTHTSYLPFHGFNSDLSHTSAEIISPPFPHLENLFVRFTDGQVFS